MYAVLALSSLFALVSAASFDDPVEHERLDSIPAGFISKGSVDPSTRLSLRINLPSANLSSLQNILGSISDPSSPDYGAHLSQSAVAALVAPSPESTDLVSQWLAALEVTSTPITSAGEWLELEVDAETAEDLLGASFETFEHTASGHQAIRTLSYSIPSALAGHINFIHPTTSFPAILPRRAEGARAPRTVKRQNGEPPDFGTFIPPTSRAFSGAAGLPSTCSDTASPACIQALYGIPTTLASSTSNALFVSGFNFEYASPTDLSSFLSEYRADIDSSTFTITAIDSSEIPYDPTSPGQEGDLDIEYTVGLASGVPTTFLSVGDEDFLTGLLNQATYLNELAAIPTVLSTSYAIDESSVSQSMASAICDLYMQLGARGMSILVATGDGGVGGTYANSCMGEPFAVAFPASCPYVTAVGATQLSDSSEIGASFTTGGFSDLFAAPSYQSAAVSSYVSQNLAGVYEGLFNGTNRAVPDIAALGVNFPITWYGVDDVTTSGTSASAPAVASIIALLNDMLITDGKPTLGFLNPLLYSAASKDAFTDITSGTNPGCGTNGFSAAAGWDPVTGLGTPIFGALQTVIGL